MDPKGLHNPIDCQVKSVGKWMNNSLEGNLVNVWQSAKLAKVTFSKDSKSSKFGD